VRNAAQLNKVLQIDTGAAPAKPGAETAQQAARAKATRMVEKTNASIERRRRLRAERRLCGPDSD
jgi:hypothetical protein